MSSNICTELLIFEFNSSQSGVCIFYEPPETLFSSGQALLNMFPVITTKIINIEMVVLQFFEFSLLASHETADVGSARRGFIECSLVNSFLFC